MKGKLLVCLPTSERKLKPSEMSKGVLKKQLSG